MEWVGFAIVLSITVIGKGIGIGLQYVDQAKYWGRKVARYELRHRVQTEMLPLLLIIGAWIWLTEVIVNYRITILVGLYGLEIARYWLHWWFWQRRHLGALLADFGPSANAADRRSQALWSIGSLLLLAVFVIMLYLPHPLPFADNRIERTSGLIGLIISVLDVQGRLWIPLRLYEMGICQWGQCTPWERIMRYYGNPDERGELVLHIKPRHWLAPSLIKIQVPQAYRASMGEILAERLPDRYLLPQAQAAKRSIDQGAMD